MSQEPVAVPPLLVVYNPIAGRRRRRFLSRVLEQLESRAASVRLEPTKARGDAQALAQAAAASGAQRLVVAGGDGTINEALNGLVGSKPALAIVPLGTANVLAAELGIGHSARNVAAAILDGRQHSVTLGMVNGRRFSMMAGVGFDAHVVRDVSSKLKRAIGKGAYVLETLRQLVVYKSKFYDVRIDGVAMRAASLLICNGHYYGGRFVAAPQARLENPDLQVVLFQRKGRFAILRYTLALALGRLPTREDVRIVSAQTIEIDGPAGEPVQGDGDIVAHLPARFEAIPNAAILVGPPG